MLDGCACMRSSPDTLAESVGSATPPSGCSAFGSRTGACWHASGQRAASACPDDLPWERTI